MKQRVSAVMIAGTKEKIVAIWEKKTSDRHTELLWVDPKDFKPENYFKGGWLKGVQEYLRGDEI